MRTARLYAWSRRHPVLIDAVLAASLFLTVGLLSAVVAGWIGVLFGALLTLPLAVRRRWPAAALASTVAVSLLQLAVTRQPLPADIVPPFVLYSVAAHVAHRLVRIAAVAAGLLACVLGPWRWVAAVEGPRTAVGLALALAVFLAVLWLLGDLVRARDGTMARLHQANEALARDRDQRDQLVAERERLAIARDVHDVVAHSLSVVLVQADGASYAAEHADRWTRDEAVAALTAIGRTARGALSETRRVVGVLREVSGSASTTPEPGLADIDRLVAAVRSAGSRWPTTGSAGPRRPTGPGSGLAGMRERVAATGGHLVAGPRTRGGYAVTATLPLESVGGGSR